MDTRKHTDLAWDLFCWVLFTVLIVFLVLVACGLTWLVS